MILKWVIFGGVALFLFVCWLVCFCETVFSLKLYGFSETDLEQESK